MLLIQSKPEVQVLFSHIDDWYEKKFGKIMPPIVTTLMAIAEEYQINPVGFVALAIVKSKLFCSEATTNNNFFDLRMMAGNDKTPELIHYSTIRSGIIAAAKLTVKYKIFDNVTEEYYNAIIEFTKTSKIVDIPRTDGTYPKAEPIDLPPPKLPETPQKKVNFPVKFRVILWWISLASIALWIASFFIPQLKFVSVVLKWLIDLWGMFL